jgi:hypothetical protein
MLQIRQVQEHLSTVYISEAKHQRENVLIENAQQFF